MRGVGVAVGPHGAGSIGFDSLMTIRPDGKLYVQSGVGNLGTHSVIDLARVAAEVLAMPWEKVEVVWGDTGKDLPWTCLSVGSQTTHAMTRANYAGAMDAKRKLQEIAARDLGGSPDDYELGDERVYRRGAPARGLSYAQAARRAIELGGRYDGHEVPDDINPMTKRVGGGARRPRPDGRRQGQLPARRHHVFVRDRLRGGRSRRRDRAGRRSSTISASATSARSSIRAACSRRSRAAAASASRTRCCRSRWSIQQYGCIARDRFHYTKPLTILDIPATMQADALDLPDPETPVGARGVGEPPVGAGYGAVMNAIADAVGDEIFRRAPVTADIVLMSLEHGRRMHEPLQAHV